MQSDSISHHGRLTNQPTITMTISTITDTSEKAAGKELDEEGT